MKHILMLFIILVLASCKKDGSTQTIEKEVVKTNTIYKNCRQMQTLNYDTSGNLTSKAIYYYTGDRLDSTVAFSPLTEVQWILKYEYSTSILRKARLFYKGVNDGSYTLQRLDENGNLIEFTSYDKNGRVGSRTVATFSCN